MREFTKHIITALKEDDWDVRSGGMRHVKSKLIIDTDDMQLREVPFKFTWWERKLVKYHARKLQERMLLAKFIEYRMGGAPKTSSLFTHDSFL